MVVRGKFATLVLSCFLVLCAPSVHAMIPDDFEDLGNGVYTGKSITPKGETVYYGCELIDSSNLKYWQHYASHCDLMSARERGAMWASVHFSQNPPPYDENIKKATGFSEKEYINYMSTLHEKKASEKIGALEGVRAGVAPFSLSDDKNTYVTYASKKPIMGRFPFEKTEGHITLKDFNRVYDDLLMCVKTTFFGHLDPLPPYYKNRGIFKNPSSILDGGYSNISLSLHGFSALVATHKFQAIKYMMVSPIPSMQKILVANLKPGDAFIGHNKNAPYKEFPPLIHIDDSNLAQIAKEGVNAADYENKVLPKDLVQYTRQQSDFLSTGEGIIETNNFIKVDALINIYRGTYKK